MTGDAGREPRAWPVIEATGDCERAMNGPSAEDCFTRSYNASRSCVGVLLPEDEPEVVEELHSLAPSVSAGAVSCCRGAGFDAPAGTEPTPLPVPGVNWIGSQLCL